MMTRFYLNWVLNRRTVTVKIQFSRITRGVGDNSKIMVTFWPCVGDNLTVMVTVLVILVTNINYLFISASGSNIQKMIPTSKFSQQHQKFVTNFKSLSPPCHQDHCHPKVEFGDLNQIVWFRTGPDGRVPTPRLVVFTNVIYSKESVY